MTDDKTLESRIERLERLITGENGRPGLVRDVTENTKQIADLTILVKAHIQSVETERAVQKARQEANDLLMTRFLKIGGAAGAILTIMNLINILVNLRIVSP